MMALIDTDVIRQKRRRLLSAGAGGAFVRAAVLGGVGVAGLALTLPGAAPGTLTVAVVSFGLAAILAGRGLHRDYPHDRLGLCNYVTLMRLVLVCALLVPLLAGSEPSWAFFGLAVLALLLDGLDGWLARRHGLVSTFGARFDVEVDSAFALVLALNVAVTTEVGVWAVLLGLPRYVFGGAGLVLPWMRRDLPERFSRKVVCVLQLAVLIAMQAPILPSMAAVLLVPVVAVALIWSFAKDVIWLWRNRA